MEFGSLKTGASQFISCQYFTYTNNLNDKYTTHVLIRKQLAAPVMCHRDAPINTRLLMAVLTSYSSLASLLHGVSVVSKTPLEKARKTERTDNHQSKQFCRLQTSNPNQINELIAQ